MPLSTVAIQDPQCIPREFNLSYVQGASSQWLAVLKQPDGTAADLTGLTPEGKILSTPETNFTTEIRDLTAEELEELLPGQVSGQGIDFSLEHILDLEPGTYRYYLAVRDGADLQTELLAGKITVYELGQVPCDCGSSAIAVPVALRGLTGPPAVGGIGAKYPFSYGDATPKLITSIGGAHITTAQIFIATTFNGVGAALQLGDAGDLDRLITTQQVDPTRLGEFETNPWHFYASNTQILLTINPGSGASQGSGYVYLEAA